MTPNYDPRRVAVTNLAIALCINRHGPNSWTARNRKRACYIARAEKMIDAEQAARLTKWQRFKAWWAQWSRSATIAGPK